jgi:cholesterol transport system auxiliary component
MKGKLNIPYFGLSLITSVLMIAGCGPKSYEKQHYILDTQRSASPVDGDNSNIAQVQRFTVDSAFSSKSLIYRTKEFKYESDFYNEFLVSPSAMITEKTRNWLSASGLFGRVLAPGDSIVPTHVVQGNVIALYGDFREKSAPKAVIEVRIFLSETETQSESGIVFGKTYKASMGLESRDPTALVAAYDRCLIEILANFERDLAAELP